MMAAAERTSPSGLAQSTMATRKTVSLIEVSHEPSAVAERESLQGRDRGEDGGGEGDENQEGPRKCWRMSAY